MIKESVMLIVFVIFISVLLARVANNISTEVSNVNTLDYDSGLRLDDSPNNLMWFVQISDIHLSVFQDNDRTVEFREFCDMTVKVLKPRVVLATGDLTDAKQKNNIGSGQVEGEWKKYHNILKDSRIMDSITWLDIRGNHDNFDVPGVLSSRNLFSKYSSQGRTHHKSYVHVVKMKNESYAFIGVDACPDQGLKRPFNFIGFIPDRDLQELKNLATESKATYTIWFGHYPTSCILSAAPGIRQVIGSHPGSLAYLCGHFHTLLGFVPNMYALQKENFLELELSDWKDSRVYRVVAIDHGLLSFADVKHRQWPVIIVTNPKHSSLILPGKDSLPTIQTSTHIRILVFSPSPIASVRVRIDNEAWENCHVSPGNEHLYLRKWNPRLYSTDLHSIKVSAVDIDGRQLTIEQPFSLDGSSDVFGMSSRILLMLDFSACLQVLFGLATLLCVLPLCFLRHYNRKSLANKRGTFKNWFRRFWLLANTDRLFFPITLYPLYMAIGPWTVGEIMNDHLGIIFIWGTFVNGHFVPELFTYGYGFVQLFLFQGPLVVFTAYTIDSRLFGSRSMRRNKALGYFLTFVRNTPFLILLLSQLVMAYTFWLAYGGTSLLFGPVRLWPVALTCWAWYYSTNVSTSKLRASAVAWFSFSNFHTGESVREEHPID